MPPGRWSLAHDGGIAFHLVAAPGDRALGEVERLTAPDAAGRPDRRGHARADHPCRDQSRRRARRPARRAADRCAGARPGAGRRPGRSGRRRGAGRAARAMGGALVAAGRGRRRMACGSTSAASRICSAARTGWSSDIARSGFAGARPDRRGVGDRADPRRRPGRWRDHASAPRARPSPASGEGLPGTLAPLPVAALRLDPDTVRTLERLGLKTIGALAGRAAAGAGAAVPRGGQSARCARPGSGRKPSR